MRTPPDLLAAMLRSDPARPRVTFYDDTPGPTSGERIELSAKVLGNWVSKAANALQDEWDLGPGSRVQLVLPPHWRALYWSLAVWSVGATVQLDGASHDLLVTDDLALVRPDDTPAVLVTLPALARSAAAPVPPGVMDEARELATYADQFSAWDEPSPAESALTTDGAPTAYASVVPAAAWPESVRVHTATAELGELLRTALAAWAVDGSVVLSRGPEPAGGRVARLTAEGVTLAL
ncbi:TIGR03089 family protein [Nostocoides sp. HKS02]|uniref:TIGR03089 family protein n=1 Tax=Nostocoides sp. HKS02 TaxID=1813880 RepID=UPI0012B4730A|nr:TIGR03089 family protein [Tetrasphaera sp. HKS02]QGN56671.1 TIGR03089 family protein [Tetrasphaera sp. HKS02]